MFQRVAFGARKWKAFLGTKMCPPTVVGHFGVPHFLLRKWSLIGYRIWGPKFGLQWAMCACDGGLWDVSVAFFAAAFPCTYVGSLLTRFDRHCDS